MATRFGSSGRDLAQDIAPGPSPCRWRGELGLATVPGGVSLDDRRELASQPDSSGRGVALGR